MISIVDISSAYNLAVETSVLAADCEISLYNIGSFHAGNSIRNKLNYLELYSCCLETIIEFTNTSIGGYGDLGFSDSEIISCIENINEIASVIFRID